MHILFYTSYPSFQGLSGGYDKDPNDMLNFKSSSLLKIVLVMYSIQTLHVPLGYTVRYIASLSQLI